ncbi:hypothetical protein PI124_g12237 [Phytophthora idaei]|nr:hypothetical protein PI124_g12237 [Phytophthora idaei]
MNDREPELHPQEQTNQIFRQRTSTSDAKRNREILERAARRAGGAVQSGQAERGDNAATESVDGCEEGADRLIPARFNNFWVNLVCTHGWSRKSRGKRIRRCYFEKPTGCKANIKAAATWNDAENFKKFMVRVIDVDVTHNHKVYENHASNRRVEDPVLLAFVDELHAAGSKPKLIVQHLRKKTGKNVLLCDFHNRVAKMKEKRRGSATAEERLERFCEGYTRQMRRWFKAFPEAMLVDATHNTNEWRYKLFSFMVNDVYGHGQYIYHSLMENESAECLTDAIGSFEFHNTSWEKIKAIVIAKDMGELGVLEKQFPGVRIILCHFHLKKSIQTEMVKSELESLWGHIKNNLRADMALDKCVDTLMFLQAVTEMEYSKKTMDVGQMRCDGADAELKKLAREVCPYAYRLIEQQYWSSKDRKLHFEVEELHPRLSVLTGDDPTSACHVDTARYHFSCVFMRTMLLPWHHVMHWCLVKGKTAISIRYVAPRWQLSSKLNQPATEEDVPDMNIACAAFQIRESKMTARRHQVLKRTTKYKHALERGKSIADIMSRNGTHVFREMMTASQKFEG